jgi:hypothetical protein
VGVQPDVPFHRCLLSLGIVESPTRGSLTGSGGTILRPPPASRRLSQTPPPYDAHPLSHDSVWCWRGTPIPKSISLGGAGAGNWHPLHFVRNVAPQLQQGGATRWPTTAPPHGVPGRGHRDPGARRHRLYAPRDPCSAERGVGATRAVRSLLCHSVTS